MSTPHHIPVNVRLTNVARLSAPQSVGGEYKQSGEKNWFLDEDYLISRRALEKMIANGWQGYGKKKRTVQRKISERDVRAWMIANRDVATRMMMEVWR